MKGKTTIGIVEGKLNEIQEIRPHLTKTITSPQKKNSFQKKCGDGKLKDLKYELE